MNAMRQIADAMRLQEPSPYGVWMIREYEAPVDGPNLLLRSDGDDGPAQYMMTIRWETKPL